MEKIKDRIFLGFIAGMIGAIPGRLLNKLEFKLGITDSRYEEMASMLFVSRRDAHKIMGNGVGKIANGLLTSANGITTAYVLSKTGRDHAMLKGIGISSMAWLGIYGISTQAQVRKSNKPIAALLSYLDHVIFGATTATLVSTLGADSIFPPHKDRDSQERCPVNGCPSQNDHLPTIQIWQISNNQSGRAKASADRLR
ncbi:hypothetical protein DEAC_c02600 [Desulfosporosinus acididurans]|uniref:Uncharacterized protein n=1 Tax=Desulfosporosinus acididurans TaxID=476652 RepID=A0A0J1FXW3_9FIRM|nr:hypothetical protein [Desulfosporosinus acididurans]KLU67853.1 hypothetical protein DEAC_c02600 [Desulfosporosinus acididurans]